MSKETQKKKRAAAPPVICPRCKRVGQEEHPCPYAEEINGDYEFRCTCCDECRHECLMDI